MAKFTDSLRGYALGTHRRDGWKCVYCGLDGRESFQAWLSLSEEHLLPKSHPDRRNPSFIVTSCMFCNVSDNRYFDHALARGIAFEGKSPQELIELRRPFVVATREDYRRFWEQQVRSIPQGAALADPTVTP